MTDGGHAVCEDVSLELHRAVAERILAEPTLLDRARRRVGEWLRDGSVARPYAEAWQAILGSYPEAPAELLVSADADLYPRNHPERADLVEGSIGKASSAFPRPPAGASASSHTIS